MRPRFSVEKVAIAAGGSALLQSTVNHHSRTFRGETPGVQLIDEHIVVSSETGTDPGAVHALLRAWYFERAAELFSVVLEERHAAFFEQRGHGLPALAVKAMRRRWGSMSPRGRMCLNVDLIRAPRRSIELVVTHELCHLDARIFRAARIVVDTSLHLGDMTVEEAIVHMSTKESLSETTASRAASAVPLRT